MALAFPSLPILSIWSTTSSTSLLPREYADGSRRAVLRKFPLRSGLHGRGRCCCHHGNLSHLKESCSSRSLESPGPVGSLIRLIILLYAYLHPFSLTLLWKLSRISLYD